VKIVRRKSKKDAGENFDRLLAQESLILEVTEEICRLLNTSKTSRQELARRLGKSKGFVTQVLSGERNMTLRTAADLADALDHRLQVRAVPSSGASSIGAVPAYLTAPSFAAHAHRALGLANVQVNASTNDWNEFARRAAQARTREPFSTQGRWAPATKAVECEDLQQANVPDHEFSLSA
jgi:transcriptional regulator with XRE-family HTH domain